MSDFLTLVQDFHRECGASGLAPSTIVNQKGENLRLVNWIKSADLYVQNLWTKWNFLYLAHTGVTVASQRENVTPATIKAFDLDTFFLEDDPITAVHYDKVKREPVDLTIEDIPSRIIILPQGKKLRFDPVPNAIYSYAADAYVKPIPLTTNTQISLIPEDFHMVIMGRALILYANYESAPEQKEQGEEIYTDYLGRLESAELAGGEDDARYKGNGAFFEVIAE